MKTIKFLTISALTIASVFLSEAFGEKLSESIPILNDYPSCDYEVIKEISLNDVISQYASSTELKELNLNVADQDDDNSELLLLKQTALADAKALGASHIVLISNKKSSSATNAANHRILGAALLGNCKNNTLTKIDVERSPLLGTTKVSLSYEFSSVTKGREMTFDFAFNREKKIKKPDLENQVVSFENGVFGLKVNDDLAVLLKKLGTPTAELILNKSDTLYAYGRNLWFVMRDNKVLSIQSDNSWLTNGLTNYFEFDERPFLSWKINGQIGIGDDMETIKKRLDGSLIEKYTYRIRAESDLFIDIRLTLQIVDNDMHYVVKNFAYGHIDKNIVIDSELMKSKPSLFERVYSDLTTASKILAPITMDQVPFEPILASRGYEDKTLHVYDKNLAMVYSDSVLSKILIGDTIFKDVPYNDNWVFGPLHSGLSEEGVKQLFDEENIFALGDYWEIYVDNLKYDLYFAKNGEGVTVLRELEVEMF
ncbi:hypothetical protein [Brumicola nitratireducens]|uniref:Lipoprotein n=1 Tax=Glaciecola nitratireducens (strain JCM 12485 / KCTC 12276 / FR1064) TaxID=1085623 RepID=G4QF06_GLANF|nr:hypothetical protein [Glaciecola nitratireducens]AEP28350.1 hypothetical protein GNIT_0196 [Glaciecola nitratireducens FR1064]